MDLFINTSALDRSAAAVTSASDFTALEGPDDFPQLTLGETVPLNVYHLSAASTYESWSADETYAVYASLGYLTADGYSAFSTAALSTVVANGKSGNLALTTTALVSAAQAALCARPRATWVQMVLQITVVDPDGAARVYAQLPMQLNLRVPPFTPTADPGALYLTAAQMNTLAAQVEEDSETASTAASTATTKAGEASDSAHAAEISEQNAATSEANATAAEEAAEAAQAAAEAAQAAAEAAEAGATEIAAGNIMGLISGRATRPLLLSDGATSNRRFEQTPGANGAIAGMPAVFYGRIDVPTSNGSVFAYEFASCASGTTTPGLQAYAFYIALSTSGTLRVAQAGITNGDTDYRRLEYGSFRTTYSGRKALAIAVVFESGDTTTNPKIYLDGVDVSASFTLTTGGTAPNWMPTTLDTTKFLSGYNWPAGRFEPFRVCLGSWTAAEVLEWAQTGNEPTWCELGTGSVLGFSRSSPNLTSDWVTVSATVDSTTQFTTAGAGGVRLEGLTIGCAYELNVSLSTTAASVDVRNGSSAPQQVFTPNAGSVSVKFIAVATNVYIRNSGAGVTTVSAFALRGNLGPISKPAIQPSCPVATDSGANRIPGLLTAGLTALGDKPEMVAVLGNPMTADGFVLADQVVTPDGYELIAAYIERIAGSGTGTITVKETSSGGTTVATGAVASGTVSLTVSNGLSASNKKLHLANSSWSSTTIQPRFVFRRFK